MSETTPKRSIWRLTPFRAGLFAGLLGGGAWVAIVNMGSTPPAGPKVEIVSSGDTLTAAGVRRIEFFLTGGPLMVKQLCAEACDDISITSRSAAGAAFGAQLWHKSGRCLDCDRSFLAEGPADTVARLDVGATGSPMLKVAHYKTQADGSRIPTPPPSR